MAVTAMARKRVAGLSWQVGQGGCGMAMAGSSMHGTAHVQHSSRDSMTHHIPAKLHGIYISFLLAAAASSDGAACSIDVDLVLLELLLAILHTGSMP